MVGNKDDDDDDDGVRLLVVVGVGVGVRLADRVARLGPNTLISPFGKSISVQVV